MSLTLGSASSLCSCLLLLPGFLTLSYLLVLGVFFFFG